MAVRRVHSVGASRAVSALKKRVGLMLLGGRLDPEASGYHCSGLGPRQGALLITLVGICGLPNIQVFLLAVELLFL